MKPLSTELIVLLAAVFLVPGGGLGAALDRAIPDPSTLIRRPFGSYNAITEQVAGQAGMKMWTWSVDTLDWTHAGVLSQKDTDTIVNLAETEEIKLNHPVILTHNPLKLTPSTVAAPPTIIEFFKAHRYIVVAL